MHLCVENTNVSEWRLHACLTHACRSRKHGGNPCQCHFHNTNQWLTLEHTSQGPRHEFYLPVANAAHYIGWRSKRDISSNFIQAQGTTDMYSHLRRTWHCWLRHPRNGVELPYNVDISGQATYLYQILIYKIQIWHPQNVLQLKCIAVFFFNNSHSPFSRCQFLDT